MPSQKKQSYTLLWVPDNGSDVKKFPIPSRLVQHRRIVLGVLGVAFLTLSVLFVRYGLAYLKVQHLQTEIAQNHQTLVKVQNQLASVNETLERLSSIEQKLRMITHLRDPERNLAMGPMSAAGGDTEKADSPFDDVIPYLSKDTIADVGGSADELLISAKRFDDQAQAKETELINLTDRLRHQEVLLARAPAIWPVSGYLTSHFGHRVSPFTQQKAFHAGIDVGAPPGTPVYAPGDGEVVFVGSKSGYGETLIIDHGYGFATCFAHLSAVLVSKGQKIKRGDLVSRVGNTGRSTGPHLHYEVRINGTPQNPLLFILN